MRHKSNGEHFYVTSLSELTDAVLLHNYAQEFQTAKVSTNESTCRLKPVYRLYKNEHFYTTSDAEASAAVNADGYTKEGIAFYCAANLNECGATKPFHRYLIGGFDHFYTGDINEGNGVIQRGGKYEGILCYTWA